MIPLSQNYIVREQPILTRRILLKKKPEAEPR
jgi:hypothetical protein